MAMSLGFTCCLPPGNSDNLCCLFLFCFFISSPLLFPSAPTVAPSVAAPWGLSSPPRCIGRTWNGSRGLLPSGLSGRKKLAIWAAVTCQALG